MSKGPALRSLCAKMQQQQQQQRKRGRGRGTDWRPAGASPVGHQIKHSCDSCYGTWRLTHGSNLL